MSVTGFGGAQELQIWNNAAFDNVEPQESSAIKNPLSSLQSKSINCTKENQNPQKSVTKPNSIKPLRASSESLAPKRHQRDLDMEIEAIEKEMSRLSSKLETLRLEKAHQTARSVAMRGKAVPAKFMEPRQKNQNPSLSNRRGVSLGPNEILGKQPRKTENVTPLQSSRNRRQSCFWTLGEIKEENVSKTKQAATTLGPKRVMKREDGFPLSIQPKKLFKDTEKSLTAKKSGRVVASRYSLTNKETRKRSSPDDNDKEESNRVDKKRAANSNGNCIAAEYGIELPMIRTLRCLAETPRDSGPVKRVAEMGDVKSYFRDSLCQELSFAEEE